MDLALHLRVLWRFRFLIVVGVLLALTLTTLSIFRVSFEGVKPSFTYRDSLSYQSVSRLQITQIGFPEGRSVLPQTDPSSPSQGSVTFADPTRFIQLAVFYSELANSDEVQTILSAEGPLAGSVQARPAGDPTRPGGLLPFIDFVGSAADPATAQKAAQRGTQAFIRFLSERQQAARIPADQRVLVRSVQEPQLGSLVEPRKKTRPIAIFLAVMIVCIGLAFILENLRPQGRSVSVVEDRGDSRAA